MFFMKAVMSALRMSGQGKKFKARYLENADLRLQWEPILNKNSIQRGWEKEEKKLEAEYSNNI